MKNYQYTIDFIPESLNKNNFYNIFFEDKIIAENIQFPYIILFEKWQPEYVIVVENISYCGSKKIYTLTGQSTTTFPVGIKSSTTVLYIPPTTTSTTSTTLTTSTTTLPLKTLKIVDVMVQDCFQSKDNVSIRVLIKFGGNYSGKLRLRITDVTVSGNISNNILIRDFNNDIIDTPTYEYILKKGTYQFEAYDVENNLISTYAQNIIIKCPEPQFEIEYIPNTCGLLDAKIRIFNIKNANIFRYCYDSTFSCNNNIDTPDAVLKNGQSELTIITNSGVNPDYVSSGFMTVRGFNNTVDVFKDVKATVTPCIVPPINNKLTVLTNFINRKDNSNTSEIVIILMKEGRKINAPTDIMVRGYYTILYNGTYVNKNYFAILKMNTNQTIIYVPTENYEALTDSCITKLDSILSSDYTLINGSPC
jgi:hypothetical protein